MTRTHMLGAHSIEYTPPTTAADVLDWTVYAQCLQGETVEETAELLARFAHGWARKWCTDPGAFDECMVELGAESFLALLRFCNVIASAAALPVSVLDNMALMLDRKNEVPDDWKEPALCRCHHCTGLKHGYDLPNPAGAKCLMDGIDDLSQSIAARVSQVKDGSERYYMEQVRAVFARAEGRRFAYEHKQREDKAESDRIRSKYEGGRRGH